VATNGNATVVMDPKALSVLFKGPSGPVMRHLVAQGELVKNEARRRVGVARPDPYTAARRKRQPGTLRDHIVKRVVPLPGGQVGISVVAEDPIALWHHEGTVPHIIRPRNGPFLVFYWPRVGRVVRLRVVRHPGTQPNRFLTDSLSVIRRR
jgi:hypothetical protein